MKQSVQRESNIGNPAIDRSLRALIAVVRDAEVAEASRAAKPSCPAAAQTKVPAAASPPVPAVPDKVPARLYRWIRGSRVPADVAADAGSFFDLTDRRPGERPRWAS